MFDNKKCVVLAVLAQHYKVEMMAGISRGQCHKYYHAAVTRLGPPPTDAPEAELAATGASATVTGATGDIEAPGDAVTIKPAAATIEPVAAKLDWEDYTFD